MWSGTLYFGRKKIWSFAIRVNKSIILSVIMLTLLPSIYRFFSSGKVVTVRQITVYQALHIQQKIDTSCQSQSMCKKSSLAWLQNEHLWESSIFLKYRNWPVGKSLYNNLYWNHRRRESCLVLKIQSNTSLASTSLMSSLFHLSKHLGLSLFLTTEA